jgi:hypothetical protein
VVAATVFLCVCVYWQNVRVRLKNKIVMCKRSIVGLTIPDEMPQERHYHCGYVLWPVFSGENEVLINPGSYGNLRSHMPITHGLSLDVWRVLGRD